MFKNNKILIISMTAIILVALLFWFTFYFRQNQTQDNLSKIENWNLYQEINKQNLGYDIFGDPNECAQVENFNQEFADFKQQANIGSIKNFLYDGVLELVITPNYNHWTNEKFLAFVYDNGAFCSAGNLGPVHAYADKLLWDMSCSSGAMPTENELGYKDFIKCIEAEQALADYFSKN